MPHLVHLARRCFGVLRSRPLTPDEQQRAAALLRPAEAALFWAQAVPDQRHGLESALALQRTEPGRQDLMRAALLHDIGKRHARLGVLGRVGASLLEIIRLPAPGRLGMYLDHGDLGAAELEAAGSDPLTVAFARFHHASRPSGIDPADWALLIATDR
jgi:hypothetical protein